jgi:Putative zinc- or iron-chelating domain
MSCLTSGKIKSMKKLKFIWHQTSNQKNNNIDVPLSTFEQLLDAVPPDQRGGILKAVSAVKERLLKYYNEHGPGEFMKGFYEIFDESIDLPLKKACASCKKGCHFCCGQNVDITDAESKLIAEYCLQNNIAIPKGYLGKQLLYEQSEIPNSPVPWCVFLKDGECSIYQVRPLACRKYYVSTPPELCDLTKYSKDKFKAVVIIFSTTEIETTAFYELMLKKGKIGRLPEMLLPYSK